ncbi:hypothetical protein Agub_g11233 [Astrephomene gubernaculifera]|uniref:AB hydrolase-1 domain-containing protein n=1 Tax=Astrephomene gubernaculifera TaxID=47775 RepID=A0AAD3HPP4_9CHLO|nr:hypothetical protein Agub_g11233 [Astrephomene gubernaculifera]
MKCSYLAQAVLPSHASTKWSGLVAALALSQVSETALANALPGTVIPGSARAAHGARLRYLSLSQQHRFSSLAFEEVTAGAPTTEHPVASPSRTLFILHGLLGCGRNWRTWARRLVEGAAATHPPAGGPWRAVLVDLRCHGASTGRPGLHPPHNMHSAAEDVSRLIQEQLGSHAPGAVLGHSLGGKVALALLEQCSTRATAAAPAPAAAAAPHHHQLPVASGAAGTTPPPSLPGSAPPPPTPMSCVEGSSAGAAESAAAAARPQVQAAAGCSHAAAGAAAGAGAAAWCAPPRQLWVLDSQPGLVAAEADVGTGVSRVLRIVHSVPLPVPSRAWLLSHLRQRGLQEHLVSWLASNLTPMKGGQQQQPQQQQGAHGGGHAGAPLTWSFNAQGAGAMYMAYRTTDFWHLLERPPYGTAVHLVQGGRSDRWPSEMQRRLLDAAAAAASPAPGAPAATSCAQPGGRDQGQVAGQVQGGARGSFQHHVLPDAGHWLHVDNPEGLLRLVVPRLGEL